VDISRISRAIAITLAIATSYLLCALSGSLDLSVRKDPLAMIRKESREVFGFSIFPWSMIGTMPP